MSRRAGVRSRSGTGPVSTADYDVFLLMHEHRRAIDQLLASA